MFILSTVIFSIGGGIFQLILSPIIRSLESDNKHSSMSLLHSFYAWEQVLIILLTTFYFFIFGKENWRFIVLFWCIIPIINFFIFLKTSLEFKQEDDEIHFLKLIKHPTFIIALIAIASGAATELIINQWISIFIKKGLNLSILFSNLVGMCGFALMLGAGFAPWLLGFLTTKFTSNMFDIQSSLKFSLLIVTIFPIITLIT